MESQMGGNVDETRVTDVFELTVGDVVHHAKDNASWVYIGTRVNTIGTEVMFIREISLTWRGLPYHYVCSFAATAQRIFPDIVRFKKDKSDGQL